MSGARLRKRARLLKAVEFRRVFDKPVKSSDKLFTVLARLNDLGHPRLGLAISKRHARHAVTRNRIKRIVRESFRQSPRSDNIDYVVMINAQAVKADNSDLIRSLQRHWHTIRDKCEKS